MSEWLSAQEAMDRLNIRAQTLYAYVSRGRIEARTHADDPRKSLPPLYGALLKNEQDVHLFERLAFLSKRERT